MNAQQNVIPFVHLKFAHPVSNFSSPECALQHVA